MSHGFVANFICFPAMQKSVTLSNLNRFSQRILSWELFLRHSVYFMLWLHVK